MVYRWGIFFKFLWQLSQVFIMILSITAAIIVMTLLYRYLALPRRSRIAHKVLKTLKKVLIWNGLVRQFLAYSLPMILASFIEFHVFYLWNEIIVFYLVTATLTIFILWVTFKKMFQIIQNIPSSNITDLFIQKCIKLSIKIWIWTAILNIIIG